MSPTKLAIVTELTLGLLEGHMQGVRAEQPQDAGKKTEDQPGKKPDLSGQITAVADGGRRITLELPPAVKGEPGKAIDIKLTDRTKVDYFGVDAQGETPTVGYVALVWLVDGSEDTAAGLRLGRKDAEPQKGPDLAGKIVAVADDLKRITLELDPKNKGDEPKKIDIKLGDKTKYSYFGVDLRIPTVGYLAQVWLAENSTDTATGIRLGLKNGQE